MGVEWRVEREEMMLKVQLTTAIVHIILLASDVLIFHISTYV